ncbi:DUF5381 family protein [Metabacillus idriensis]|uniref:DUF5381 family protein n=1 Tax=Metabacillus idriensis TaxID=324768 RepID=UPI00174CE1D7|nr:DUF5381 family protein [Metabacillus idriensis]
MLNLQKENNSVKIKGSKFMYVWMLLATFGGLAACFFLIINGFKFDSKYSFFYLGGGFLLFPIFLYLTLWSLPGFVPGKTLLVLTEGSSGFIMTKINKIPFSNIRSIRIVRNPLNLINDIVIETFQGEVSKIRTYNLIDDTDFTIMVDQFIYPNMREDAKEFWDRHVNLSELFEDAKHERKTNV